LFEKVHELVRIKLVVTFILPPTNGGSKKFLRGAIIENNTEIRRD